MAAAALSKVVVTRRLPKAMLAMLDHAFGRVELWDSEDVMPRAKLLAAVDGTAAIVCTLSDTIDDALMQAVGRPSTLKIVSTMSAGYSHIDVAAVRAAGARIGFTPDALTETTADLALALTLAARRRVIEAAATVRSGQWSSWKPYWMCGRDLHHATVGIVGAGRIGRAVSRRLTGFGCSLRYTGRSGRKADFEAEFPGSSWVSVDDAFSTCDIVIAICALTPETRGLVQAPRLRSMREGALFVNVSRGEVVNQGDLFDVLSERPDLTAALDVTTPEPLPLDSPLLTLPNCVILPHIGSATLATRDEMARIAISNAVLGAEGGALLFEVTD